MRASSAGIEVSKAELGALLFFAGGATKDGVVKFRIGAGGKLVACASDGKRAVECEANAGDADTGEWAVPASFLETLRRGINKGKTEAILEVNSKGLKHARLRGAASKDKQIGIEDETNGTSTQLSMAQVHNLVKRPELTGSWFAIVPKQVNRAIDVVCKAADNCPITVYPPQDANEHVCFEASSEGGRWRGMFQPAAVIGPGDEADEEEDEAPPGRQPSLPGTGGKASAAAPSADEDEGDSGVVDDEYAEKLKTQKTPKRKVAKKAAKKGRKKS
jgi:hypothetical protein